MVLSVVMVTAGVIVTVAMITAVPMVTVAVALCNCERKLQSRRTFMKLQIAQLQTQELRIANAIRNSQLFYEIRPWYPIKFVFCSLSCLFKKNKSCSCCFRLGLILKSF